MYAFTILLPLLALCAGAAVFDLRLHRVPNLFNATFFLCGICIASARAGIGGLVESLAGAGIGFAFLLVPFFLHMVGGGDVKFLAAAGAIVGLHLVWPALIAGAAFGGIFALVALLLKARSLDPVRRAVIMLEQGLWRSRGETAGEHRIMLPYTLPLSCGFVAAAVVQCLSRGVT
ncbi:MAG: A24 family peptidase [Candidatus Geothermincolia bacterium]